MMPLRAMTDSRILLQTEGRSARRARLGGNDGERVGKAFVKHAQDDVTIRWGCVLAWVASPGVARSLLGPPKARSFAVAVTSAARGQSCPALRFPIHQLGRSRPSRSL
jgi:hypothetical protein